MYNLPPNYHFTSILSRCLPDAAAHIKGDASHPHLFGVISLYQTSLGGILFNVEINGLPKSQFYGMHIHEHGDCSNDFANTGSHYNPSNMMHPLHAGDLPPLLSNNGYAWMAFYTDRLTLKDSIGKSIVIHSMRDDFSTQPAGDSGSKIGCGIIQAEV